MRKNNDIEIKLSVLVEGDVRRFVSGVIRESFCSFHTLCPTVEVL
jgi:hypothetical protein